MIRDLITSAALALGAIAAAWLFWPEARQMPDTSFHLTDGRTLSSSELRGRSVLINFWSISCEVCLRDIPTLTRLHERLQPQYPVALDVHGEISAAFGGIEATPTSILVRPDGSISHRERGPIDESRIRATLLTF
jgi:thiol-disulfide isomerase/thioredoxin